ncbi:MAG: hypothetical protein AABX54_04395 [Nanoarchaeota archaeon]
MIREAFLDREIEFVLRQGKREDYRTPEEFDKPFFVIVHSAGARNNPDLDQSLVEKVMREIREITQNYDHIFLDYAPSTILPEVPRDRPILVCGFYGDVCVDIQRQTLRSQGYDAYISDKGTFL